MSGVRMVVAALAIALSSILLLGPVRAQTPPLEVYGATPTIDHIALSPSGGLVARIVVLNEARALMVSRLDTAEHVFAAAIGEAKVRDLSWIGEQRVLIITSETQSIHELGVPRSELFYGLVLDLETKNLVQVLRRTPDVLATLYGGASIRRTTCCLRAGSMSSTVRLICTGLI